MASPPSFVADFDSATAMAQSTAAYLRGEDWPALGNPKLLEPPVSLANLIPRKAREQIFIASGALETTSPKKMGDIDLDEIGEWLLELYPERRYPAVGLGSSSGAAVYLNAALGTPWLPQTVFLPVRQPVHPDDPTTAMENGIEPGRALMEANPDWQLHHMHDANQDRLMVRILTYFRVKRRNLGGGYERFLSDRLPPGGTLLLYECRTRWNTTRIGERHVFQHGAVGGATEREFHEGSDRVEDYLERYDSPKRRWDGPEPDTVSPEAEWGFEESLRDDVLRFAREHRYRVRRIVFDGPDDLSPLVADLYRWWYRRRRIPSNRLMVTSFVINDAYRALRTGSVPYWMRFNMQPSVDGVRRFLDEREPFDDIHLALFQHGVNAVGIPSPDDWREVLSRARREGSTLGADLDEFPHDFAQYAKYNRAMKQLSPQYPIPGPLSLAEFDEFLAQAGNYDRVSIEDIAPDGERTPVAA
ncbi:hypothetical protein [Egicoccus halophilus]|uniref:Uncharacterized protein n=1 Tax=Egicoccus halophilus TaxID=1670830 RepID=A0A8J3AB99_9ACTN|nr:hypothetical protein [Egicoccus halophilus]GGI02838.1 hypothetical protein GCM10011354_01720 [Egicoccus halophilus]